MKKLTLILLLASFSFSCQEAPVACGVSEDNMPAWLNDLINELKASSISEYNYINSGIYKSQEVFILKDCCPFCASVFVVYSCDGNQIGTIGSDDINPDKIRKEKLFWAASGNQCNGIN